MKYRAFVSYSRHDKLLVQPLVELMEVGKQRVFWDQDSISPGDDWRLALARGVEDSETLVVFWCCHAERSEWVAHEVHEAARLGKPVVPFLLCGQALPETLARFQWIDCRQGARHACLEGHGPAPGPPTAEIGQRARQALAPSASRGLLLAAFSGAAVTASVAVLAMTFEASPLTDVPATQGYAGSAGFGWSEPPDGLEAPPAAPGHLFWWIGPVLLLVCVGAVTWAIGWGIRRLRTRHLRKVLELPAASQDLARMLLGVMALQERGKLQRQVR